MTDSEHAFYSHETGVDWDVIFLLLGMMVIVGVLRRTGVFEYVAIWAAKRAKGSPLRVMILLTLITAVASAFLDNVTTVLLIAPVTLLVCDRLGINPVPFLIAEVMASNIGGAATLIGDPPNIIIASRSGLTFNDFLVHMAPLVVIELVVFTLVLPRLFKGSFAVDPAKVENVMRLNEREAIQDPPAADQVRRRLAAVFTGFVGHAFFHVEPSVVALLGAGVLVLISKVPTRDYMNSVEWQTLLFFAGLFIMVGALVKTGVIGDLADQVGNATEGRPLLAVMLILVRLGGPVRHRRQHPVRRDHEPGRSRTDQERGRPRPGSGPVVGAGRRRRLRRQRHRGRRQRQRRRHRHRAARRAPDQLLGVHPQGHRRSPRSRSSSRRRTCGCGTSSWPDRR